MLLRADLQREVALVGFDDFPAADLLDPSVTVIAQDPDAMGRLAADILFRRIDGDRSPPESRTLLAELVVRQSGIVTYR